MARKPNRTRKHAAHTKNVQARANFLNRNTKLESPTERHIQRRIDRAERANDKRIANKWGITTKEWKEVSKRFQKLKDEFGDEMFMDAGFDSEQAMITVIQMIHDNQTFDDNAMLEIIDLIDVESERRGYQLLNADNKQREMVIDYHQKIAKAKGELKKFNGR